MADGSIGGILSPITDAVTGGASSSGSGAGGSLLIPIIALIVGIVIVSVIVAVVWFFWIEKRKWNLITRVHYENPTINGVSMGNPIPTRRLRFKDGRVVYLYKSPIQGYTISPELLIWTRPREHDVIVTQDKRIFCLIGIENIDVKRKKLNVDILHPDIEMDRQDLQQHIDSKKFDDPNEKLKLIAKVTGWVFIMVTIIVVMVLGGKYYIDGKNADLARDKLNLQISDSQRQVMNDVNTFITILQRNFPEFNNTINRISLNDTGVS